MLEAEKKNFARTLLPWLAAAGALMVYLVTLNHWVTLNSLPQVVRVAGWDWRSQIVYGSPLFFLLTYPLHWLPGSWLPVALNLFTAICAALTLALLARSVTLLPHDRTQAQRDREESEFSLLSIRAAWLPPALAVLVCGLQLTFWENATAATGEMFDLLLFAYVIRCLLEYRVDQREVWIKRFALVYGAAMVNNWAMVGFFPLFLIALVWMKGVSFFNMRFLSRLMGWGLVGLSLYLLLPLVQSFSGDSQITFWQALRFSIASQKNTLLTLPYNRAAIFMSEHPFWVLGLTSLLPLLAMGIRWASYFGDNSPMGVAIATFMFHVVHAVFLAACIWVAFDPNFSPRLYLRLVGFDQVAPCLTFYYLAALSVGYFSGYFLLICGQKPRRQPRVDPLRRKINALVKLAIWFLLIAVPLELIYKNLPQVRATNGPVLSQYASLVTQSLPKNAVVLSDDPRRLFLVQAALNRDGDAKRDILVNTFSFQLPQYHRYLNKQYPQQWPADLSTNQTPDIIDSSILVAFLAKLAKQHEIFYLHPSFGYYFEHFYLQPHGVAYSFKLYPTNVTIHPPPMTAEVIEENQAFWKRIDADMLTPVVRLSTADSLPKTGLGERVMEWAHLSREPSVHAQVAGTFYSRSLNYWGTELQKSGRIENAHWCFARAQDLNPDNIVARINQQYNENLQAGRKTSVELSKSVEDAFGKYRGWVQLMGENGPFDEPKFCHEQARVFARGGLFRQAAQQFERAGVLDPSNLSARMWLAELYSTWQLPDLTLGVVTEIHSHPETITLDRTNQVRLLYLESQAQYLKTNTAAADRILQTALDANPTDESLLVAAANLYLRYARYTNALTTINQHLQVSPDNSTALINKAYLLIQLGDYRAAIPPLDHLLAVNTNHYDARFNRAIALLRSERLDDAQRDYEVLQKMFPSAYQIYYGLHEIAFRKKNIPAAINYCQLYLSNSPPNTAEAKFIAGRLAQLKSGSP